MLTVAAVECMCSSDGMQQLSVVLVVVAAAEYMFLWWRWQQLSVYFCGDDGSS